MDAKQKIDTLTQKLESSPTFAEIFYKEMKKFIKEQNLQLQEELEEEDKN